MQKLNSVTTGEKVFVQDEPTAFSDMSTWGWVAQMYSRGGMWSLQLESQLTHPSCFASISQSTLCPELINMWVHL